jgi:hypothetical protein
MSRTKAASGKPESGSGRLDAAIDRAVREMLDVEPPAGLRGRVLDRIENPGSRGWSWTWIAGPLVAAAMVILLVLAPWRHAAPVVPAAVPVIARVEPAPAVRAVARPRPPEGAGRAPRSPVRDRRAQPRVEAASIAVAEVAEAIEPLSPIAPVSVPVMTQADIKPTEIGVARLTPVVELQIAPLSPPDRRN